MKKDDSGKPVRDAKNRFVAADPKDQGKLDSVTNQRKRLGDKMSARLGDAEPSDGGLVWSGLSALQATVNQLKRGQGDAATIEAGLVQQRDALEAKAKAGGSLTPAEKRILAIVTRQVNAVMDEKIASAGATLEALRQEAERLAAAMVDLDLTAEERAKAAADHKTKVDAALGQYLEMQASVDAKTYDDTEKGRKEREKDQEKLNKAWADFLAVADPCEGTPCGDEKAECEEQSIPDWYICGLQLKTVPPEEEKTEEEKAAEAEKRKRGTGESISSANAGQPATPDLAANADPAQEEEARPADGEEGVQDPEPPAPPEGEPPAESGEQKERRSVSSETETGEKDKEQEKQDTQRKYATPDSQPKATESGLRLRMNDVLTTFTSGVRRLWDTARRAAPIVLEQAHKEYRRQANRALKRKELLGDWRRLLEQLRVAHDTLAEAEQLVDSLELLGVVRFALRHPQLRHIAESFGLKDERLEQIYGMDVDITDPQLLGHILNIRQWAAHTRALIYEAAGRIEAQISILESAEGWPADGDLQYNTFAEHARDPGPLKYVNAHNQTMRIVSAAISLQEYASTVSVAAQVTAQANENFTWFADPKPLLNYINNGPRRRADRALAELLEAGPLSRAGRMEGPRSGNRHVRGFYESFLPEVPKDRYVTKGGAITIVPWHEEEEQQVVSRDHRLKFDGVWHVDPGRDPQLRELLHRFKWDLIGDKALTEAAIIAAGEVLGGVIGAARLARASRVGTHSGVGGAIPPASGAGTALGEAGGSRLVHLTGEAEAALIGASGKLVGKRGIFAIPESVAEIAGTLERVLRTGLPREQTVKLIRIPEGATAAFERPLPLGPYSALRRLGGVRFARPGTILLEGSAEGAAGTFIPSSSLIGPRTLIYGPDVLIYGAVGYTYYLQKERE